MRPLALLAFLALAPCTMRAQVCEPPKTSNEADIFAIRSLSFVMSNGKAPVVERSGVFRLGAEVTGLPSIDDATATPTNCRAGKGPENVNALPALARIRASLSLPAHFDIAVSWLPPVEIRSMKGNLFGLALGYTKSLSAAFTVGARAHATLGNVTGAFTCDADALQDASSECYQGTESSDRLEPNVRGGDLALGWSPLNRSFALHGGAGINSLAPRFHVHFLNAAGELDNTLVRVDMTRVAFFGGVTLRPRDAWRGAIEAYATADDGMTLRLLIDRRFR